MSRIVGFCFVLGDAVTTVAAFLNSSGILLVAILSIMTSIMFASTSAAVRSILWPTYFWDQPEPAPAVIPKRRE